MTPFQKFAVPLWLGLFGLCAVVCAESVQPVVTVGVPAPPRDHRVSAFGMPANTAMLHTPTGPETNQCGVGRLSATDLANAANVVGALGINGAARIQADALLVAAKLGQASDVYQHLRRVAQGDEQEVNALIGQVARFLPRDAQRQAVSELVQIASTGGISEARRRSVLAGLEAAAASGLLNGQSLQQFLAQVPFRNSPSYARILEAVMEANPEARVTVITETLRAAGSGAMTRATAFLYRHLARNTNEALLTQVAQALGDPRQSGLANFRRILANPRMAMDAVFRGEATAEINRIRGEERRALDELAASLRPNALPQVNLPRWLRAIVAPTEEQRVLPPGPRNALRFGLAVGANFDPSQTCRILGVCMAARDGDYVGAVLSATGIPALQRMQPVARVTSAIRRLNAIRGQLADIEAFVTQDEPLLSRTSFDRLTRIYLGSRLQLPQPVQSMLRWANERGFSNEDIRSFFAASSPEELGGLLFARADACHGGAVRRFLSSIQNRVTTALDRFLGARRPLVRGQSPDPLPNVNSELATAKESIATILGFDRDEARLQRFHTVVDAELDAGRLQAPITAAALFALATEL